MNAKITPRDELKKKFNTKAEEPTLEDDPSDIVKEAVEEAKVELTKKQLQEIVQQAKDEMRQETARGFERDLGVGDWKQDIGGKDRIPVARMRLWRADSGSDFGLVVDWKHYKDEYDEKTRAYDKQMYELTVLMDDGEIKKPLIPIVEFSKINDFETVQLIDKEETVLSKTHGQVRRSEKNREGYAMSAHPSGGTDNVMLGEFVPLKETKVLTIFTAKRPNGKTIKINNDRLNA